MRAGSEDGSRFRRARRDRDLLDDDLLLLALNGGRALDLSGVVSPRPESEHQGQRDGKQPVLEPGDEHADAEDPRRRRDEIDQDEKRYGQGSEPMEPLGLMDREPIRRGMGFAVSQVRAMLNARNRVRSDEHDGEQDLRVLEHVKRRVANRLVRNRGRISRRTVKQDLPAGSSDHLKPPGSDDGAREAQRAHQIVGIVLDDLSLVEGGRVEREVTNKESPSAAGRVRREVQPESHPVAEEALQVDPYVGPNAGSGLRQVQAGSEKKARPTPKGGRGGRLESGPGP